MIKSFNLGARSHFPNCQNLLSRKGVIIFKNSMCFVFIYDNIILLILDPCMVFVTTLALLLPLSVKYLFTIMIR